MIRRQGSEIAKGAPGARRQRVPAPETNTMEMLEYLDMMAAARARQLEREAQ